MANTTLQPGFRFHPTDVELIMYYLKRKVLGKKLHLEVIREVNINKFTPWDLPDKSFIKSHDREWYFFCPIERKYAKGGRMNRTAEGGYWKTTGQDRTISYKDRIVGMLKTLIFHKGHPPKGERTDWVMHEYRMKDQQLVDAGVAQDAFVLCKLFHKDGPGPRNGAQYGAIFIEEEWDDPTPDPAETTQTDIGGSEVISTSFLAEPEAPDCGRTLPSGIPMSVDTEENPPFVPEEVMGISLVEDVDFESLWASITEDDLPTDLPNGYENDAFSNLPDLYNWPEMQPYPDSYLEMNDLNNPLHLAEYTNMTEHMFSVNSDYVSVPSQSCYIDSTFVASEYASSSTETHFQAAGSDFNSNVSTHIHMPAGGPIFTGNLPRGGGLNQNCSVAPHMPLLAVGPNLTGNLYGGGGLSQHYFASTYTPLPAAGPNFAGGRE